MDLRTFQDRIYARYENQLFVFEPSWDTFRPIEHVAWDGKKYIILDQKFKQDLFDPNYGYGNLTMKATCRRVSQDADLEGVKEIKDAVEFWKWSGEKELKWWNDRPILFASPCVSREISGWKNYLKYENVRAKTLRQPVRGRLTKRLGIKKILEAK
jgi:hypothetical protein